MEQQLEMVKQAQRATYISLTSDFASDYFNLIKADKLSQIQEDLIKTQEKILSMTQDKYETGLCTINEVLAEEKYLTSLKEEKNKHDLTKNLLKESLKVYLKHILTFIYTIDMTIIYIIIIYHLNKGYFHIYFIMMVFIGFFIGLVLHKKLLSKIDVKRFFKN